MAYFIRIKGWGKYQHYKNRNPPWIKLHQELLTSLTWTLSDNASRVLAISIMMIAAKTGNKIPANPEYLQRVAYLHELPDFSQLLHLEFIEIIDDSGNVISDASVLLADARPEKETEAEKETEKTKPSASPKARGVSNSSQLAKAQCETRHNRCHQLIMGWYRDWAGIECPWNGAEGRQLSSLLKAWPGAHDAEFMLCLDNIAQSDCIAPGTRPCEWLAKLPKFIKGPLDQYWKSKQVTDGNSKAQQRERERDAKWAGIVADRNGTYALPEGSGNGLRPRLESGTDRPVAEPADDGTEIPPARNH